MGGTERPVRGNLLASFLHLKSRLPGDGQALRYQASLGLSFSTVISLPSRYTYFILIFLECFLYRPSLFILCRESPIFAQIAVVLGLKGGLTGGGKRHAVFKLAPWLAGTTSYKAGDKSLGPLSPKFGCNHGKHHSQFNASNTHQHLTTYIEAIQSFMAYPSRSRACCIRLSIVGMSFRMSSMITLSRIQILMGWAETFVTRLVRIEMMDPNRALTTANGENFTMKIAKESDSLTDLFLKLF